MKTCYILQSGSVRFTDVSPAALSSLWGVAVGSTLPMRDILWEGPQHVDLDVQERMRMAYFRSDADRGLPASVDACVEILAAGDDLLIWATSDLTACLNVLWVVDWLHTHGAGLENASLVIDPEPQFGPHRDADTVTRGFQDRVPLLEVVQPLIDLRRQVASPDWGCRPDLRAVPVELHAWAAITRRMEDFLPDHRGLNLFEGWMLDAMSEEWSLALDASVAAMVSMDPVNSPGDFILWEWLVQMSDQSGVAMAWAQRPGRRRRVPGSSRPTWSTLRPNLCEMRINGEARVSGAQVRITPLGLSVRSGEEDALQHRRTFRWSGGRLLRSDGDWRTPTVDVLRRPLSD